MATILVVLAACALISVDGVSATRAIEAFGGSLTDTGNAIVLSPNSTFFKPPYGTTFPGYPTGRLSNGRLIIDYLAKALCVQEVVPFFQRSRSPLANSINFAEAGATAANLTLVNPFYLLRQVDQFVNLKLPVQSSTTLFLIEAGRNDIQEQLTVGNKTIKQVRDISVPQAIESLSVAFKALYAAGARKLIIFSNTPLGCSPLFKTLFASNNSKDYDQQNCLIAYNQLSILFNQQLLNLLGSLNREHPDAKFIYADLYDSFYQVVQSRRYYGFTDVQNACCGSGGPYNYLPSAGCGTQMSRACSNPEQFVFWDEVHFTQQYYFVIAQMFLRGENLYPPQLIQM